MGIIYTAEGMAWPMVNILLIFFSCIFFLVVFIFFLSKGSDVIPVAAIIDFIYFSGNIFEV